MNKASRITALNFINNDLINITLNEVEDDYDVCIIDCSPGRFLLHDNIFKAADLLLIPNIPAPLSVYCNDLLVQELQKKVDIKEKVMGFYNMVQAHKTMHKHYLDNRNGSQNYILNSYVPFYTEIENISLKKESIFHQLKAFKTNIYYEKLWAEICERFQWLDLTNKSVIIDIADETTPSIVPLQTGLNEQLKANG